LVGSSTVMSYCGPLSLSLSSLLPFRNNFFSGKINFLS
jgi:hypothetical protein